MLRRDAEAIVQAANRFLTADKTEIPSELVDNLPACVKGKAVKISGEDYEILKPFFEMVIGISVAVGDFELSTDGRAPVQVLRKYAIEDGRENTKEAYVRLPEDWSFETEFLLGLYIAVEHISHFYKSVKKEDLTRKKKHEGTEG